MGVSAFNAITAGAGRYAAITRDYAYLVIAVAAVNVGRSVYADEVITGAPTDESDGDLLV